MSESNPEESQPTDTPTRVIADAIKLAFFELKDDIFKLLIEVQTTFDDEKDAERDPEIEYSHRLHVFKAVVDLSGYVLAFLLVTFVYTYNAGNFFASLVGVVSLLVLMTIIIRLAYQRQQFYNDREDVRKFKRLSRIAIALIGLVLSFCVIVLLGFAGVRTDWSTSYLAVSAVILYFMLRKYYMWLRMTITRDGGILRAERPEKGIFFLPTFNRELYLHNVNKCEYAQSWIEQKLGMYRILMSLDTDMPDRNGNAQEKELYKRMVFWTNLRYVVDGNQLKNAVHQGGVMRER